LPNYRIDITPFTGVDFKGDKNFVDYEPSTDGSSVLVTIIGPGQVSYTLAQIAGARRLEDDVVFARFAKSFGVTTQLLQSVIVVGWLQIKIGESQ